MSNTFKLPPINEIVVAVYFNPPLTDLQNEHVGLFWDRIRDEFPVVQQHPPIGINLEVVSDGLFPMPRYWFISHDEVNLIQLQKNAFMYNWRRQSADDIYPGYYTKIKPTFDKYFGVFNEFIGDIVNGYEPKVGLCELSYINSEEQNGFWNGYLDTPKVIPSFSIVDVGIETADFLGFNCNYGYLVSPDLQLSLSIRSGNKRQQPNVPVLVFEIKATGRFEQITKPGADEWFERAHDTVEKCFVGVTDSEVRTKLWKQAEVDI